MEVHCRVNEKENGEYRKRNEENNMKIIEINFAAEKKNGRERIKPNMRRIRNNANK